MPVEVCEAAKGFSTLGPLTDVQLVVPVNVLPEVAPHE